MQNTSPIQSNGAAAPPQRTNQAPNADPGQFSAALTREIEQRQDKAPAPAPQPKPAAQPQQSAPEQSAQADEASAPQPARPQAAKPGAKKTGKAAEADDTRKDADKSDQHPATIQVTDMLALVASLKPLQNAATAKSAGEHAASLAAGAVGKGAAGDAGHLAALHAAAKALGKDGDAAAAKGAAAADALKDQAADALSAVADHKAGKDAVDLRAVQDQARLKVHGEPVAAHEALAGMAAMKDPAPAAPLVAQMQPATLEVAQAAANAAGERIAARVGTSAWENQVGQKIVWMVGGEEQSASLTLNPPDLGPLQVVLNVNNDQASVTFSSNQQEVRQALENALPRLREMMSASGIALGNASVNAGMPDQQQASFGNQPHGSGGGGSARFGTGAAIADTTTRPVPRVSTLGGRGAVDTFA